MWVFTNRGFLSIVEQYDEPGTLIVRSRFPGHIKVLFPETEVSRTPDHGYLYRAFLPRKEVAKVIRREVEAIDYGNFKNSVGDPAYNEACHDVWFTLYDRQRRG